MSLPKIIRRLLRFFRLSKLEVKPLNLKPSKKPLSRKIRSDHGYPFIALPKRYAALIGSKVIVDETSRQQNPHNPFAWELKVVPAPKDDARLSNNMEKKKE